MSKVVLEAKGLKKKFHHPVEVSILDGVDFVAHAGETVAILGASGEGKSTLLQILGTLEEPSEGTLSIQGQAVTRRHAPRLRNREIGFIFQSFFLLEDYSTLDNVLMPAKIGRRSGKQGSTAYKRALELLDLVGLSDRAHFPAKLLSGGEKQRVAIARALINDPQIVFADEPSGNLDSANSEVIHDLLLTAVKENDKTLITVTHDQALAGLCDTTYRLANSTLHRI